MHRSGSHAGGARHCLDPATVRSEKTGEPLLVPADNHGRAGLGPGLGEDPKNDRSAETRAYWQGPGAYYAAAERNGTDHTHPPEPPTADITRGRCGDGEGREADIAASLWHPHIVAVHDRGEHDGQLWITMDYVEGTDAAQQMRDRYPHGMPTKNVLEIVSAIADALDYAHERYLLHRDVKPANILLTDPRMGDRRILLADFGIARAANDINGLTATNVTVGSVAYAAPEQLTGKAVDGRADQYALACTDEV